MEKISEMIKMIFDQISQIFRYLLPGAIFLVVYLFFYPCEFDIDKISNYMFFFFLIAIEIGFGFFAIHRVIVSLLKTIIFFTPITAVSFFTRMGFFPFNTLRSWARFINLRQSFKENF